MRSIRTCRCALIAVALLVIATAVGPRPAAGADPQPNVVIILADDLGWGDLDCYGHETFQTPRLDRMAAEGARLTDFYMPAPYCAPSRAAVQTGRYQFRCRMTANPFPKEDLGGVRGGDQIGLPAEEKTLGEMFQAAGYRTGYVGKWHLGHQPQFFPTNNGYDEYLGILYSNDMHPVELYDDERMIEYPVVQATLTRRYTERAVEFIGRESDQPFFLFLAHAMPHKPLAVSEEFYTPGTRGDLYADVMAELDWSVGQVLDKLTEIGADENTLVLFTSDNGPWYGGSTGGLRGMKGRTAEGGIRVPLIARWPGRIPAAHVSREPAVAMDLFTTALAAANIEPPTDRTIDGRDIMPLLTSDAASPHEAIFSLRGNQLSTIRAGRWKLHVRPTGPPTERVVDPGEPWTDPRGPDGVRILAPYEQYHPSDFPGAVTGAPFEPMSLFDVQADPAEQHNVAAEHPDVVQRLKAAYDQMAAEMSK